VACIARQRAQSKDDVRRRVGSVSLPLKRPLFSALCVQSVSRSARPLWIDVRREDGDNILANILKHHDNTSKTFQNIPKRTLPLK
jgi:hypothetical protein